MIPLLEIPVWPGEVIYLAPQPAIELGETSVQPEATAEEPYLRDALLAIYLAGAVFLLGTMVKGCMQIRRMRRNGHVMMCYHGCRIVRTSTSSAFSFFRTIYLPTRLRETELPAIIAHETSHIRHRHTLERLSMEILKALLWWNPFVWMASRSLTEVQEYEADNDVLQAGHDRSKYIETIFNAQFGYSPDIASGLRDSLTKKRFQMMTKRRGNRHALLRLAGTLPVIGLLVAGFSFTTRAAEIRYTSDEQPAAARQKEKKEFRITIDKEADSVALATSDAANADNMEITVNDTPIKGMTTVTITSRKAGKGNMAVAANGTTMKNVSTVTVTSDKSDREKKILIIDGKVIEEPAAAAESSDGQADNKTIKIVNGKLIEDATATDSATETAKPGRKKKKAADEEAPLLVAEVMPRFTEGKGTLNDFRSWVQQRVAAACKANPEIQGRVVLTFVIERDGSVGEIVTLQSTNDELAKIARRTIASSPKWTPGMTAGKPVRVKYTIPISAKPQKKSDKAVKAVILPQSGDAEESLDHPLIYLEGKEIDVSEMEKIDPNTIESISVLKEKSAIAQYGEKGKNGVIEIYLKKSEPTEK